MTERKPKAAIYARTSKQEQILENQLAPLKRHCENMGWDYEVFTEQESTRKTRPVQWGLYQKLLLKKYDILLIFRLDRWARTMAELVQHLEALHNRGVRVVSYTENIDLSNALGRTMMHVIALFANFERDVMSERINAGLARAKSEGKKLGRPKGAKDQKSRKKGGYYLRYMQNKGTKKGGLQ